MSPIMVLLALASAWGALMAFFLLFTLQPFWLRVIGSVAFGAVVAVICTCMLVYLGAIR